LIPALTQNKDSLAVLIFIFILLLSPLADGKDLAKGGPVDFTFEPILSSEWACYFQDGGLYVRKYGSAPIKIRDSGKPTVSLQSPDLHAGDLIFVTWMEKGAQGKRVLFKASYDGGKTFGDAVEISPNTNATGIMSFIDKNGSIYIFEGAMGEKVALYISLSIDKGKTFKRYPLEIEGLSALYNLSPLVVKDALYLCFSGIKDGKKVIGIKEIEINSMKAKELKILKETESVSFIEVFKIKDNPAFIYKTAREGRFVLDSFIKENADYMLFPIKGAEGLDVARMDYYVWEDGRVLVVFSGEERGKFKQRIYAAVSEDGGKNWDVRRIDNKEFDNTRSWLPRMAVHGERVAVVWEDSRGIRPGVRMKLSPDRGRTWMEKDIPLSGGKNFAFRPRISFAGGGFHVAWHQFRDDEKKVADLTMVKLNWDDAVKRASRKEKGSSLKEKEALLRKKVMAYWEGMMKKDLKTTYMIHDPFYRARIPFDYYASHRGPMVFHSYSIEGVRIEGNEAFVNLKVRYEVPKITILGKETSIPSKEITAEDTYLFIDGTWYRKFVDALSGGSAIDY